MSKTIIFGDTIIVNPRVFFGYRDNLSRYPKISFNFDNNVVCGSFPNNGHSRRFPFRTFWFVEGDGFSVKGEGKAIFRVIPCGCFLGTKEELMIVKENNNGLNPCEVSFHVLISSTYEVSVYMEVGIRYKAEVVIFLAMEVKSDSITTNETRVLANSSWFVTLCNSLCSNIKLVMLFIYFNMLFDIRNKKNKNIWNLSLDFVRYSTLSSYKY